MKNPPRASLVAALALVTAPVACDRAGAPGSGAPSGPVEIRSAVAERRDLPRVIPAVGATRADHRVSITTEIPGDLIDLSFTDGQRVKKGDAIATIDDSEQQAEVARAKADLAKAEFEYSRTQLAQQQQAATDLELKTALANRDAAAATVKATEAVLEKCRIMSPFDGRLSRRLVDPGAYIAAGTPIVQLESEDALLVDFEVPEEVLTLLTVGMPAKVSFEGIPDPIEAKVTSFGPQVRVAAHALPVRAQLPAADPRLTSGMFARVEVQAGTRPVLVVPTSAVIFATSSASVWVVEGETATERRVATGAQLNDSIEIKSGLTVGERIVTAGAQKLRGSPATVKEAAPAPSPPRGSAP